MAELRPICLFVILFIGANGLGDGCLFVCFYFDWGKLLAVFFIISFIVFDGSRGGFVVFFLSFFRSGWMDRGWLGAVGCGSAGPITPPSSGKPLPERIRLLKMWNFLHWYLIAKLDQLTID